MICDTLKQLALNTWNKIEESTSVNFQLKEETFTDLNMLDLKLNHPTTVKTKVFTKHEEGKNGADWEWWFRNNRMQWIGVRVQAKIINNNSNEFEHLHYKSPKTGLFQCDKLLKNALTKRHPKIPVYCFYIQTGDITLLKTWGCKSVSVNRSLWGCSITSAFEIHKLRPSNSKHLKDLESNLKPWHCLVCCSGYGGGNNSVENINEYVKANFKIDKKIIGELNLTIPETFITQKPPQYVLDIIENENNDNTIVEDEDLRGVMIYTFDDEENL